FRLCGVFDSRGGVARRDGFSHDEVKTLLEMPRGGVSAAAVGQPAHIEEALDYCQVVVDVSPPNYRDGEPSASLYKKALAKGLAVVTANKAPLALYFHQYGGRVYHKATVMAGTPLADLLKGLYPPEVKSVRGI
ncbi:MAG: homoserine dehydrogenase, partial [Pyrobaculum sp.]